MSRGYRSILGKKRGCSKCHISDVILVADIHTKQGLAGLCSKQQLSCSFHDFFKLIIEDKVFIHIFGYCFLLFYGL